MSVHSDYFQFKIILLGRKGERVTQGVCIMSVLEKGGGSVKVMMREREMENFM